VGGGFRSTEQANSNRPVQVTGRLTHRHSGQRVGTQIQHMGTGAQHSTAQCSTGRFTTAAGVQDTSFHFRAAGAQHRRLNTDKQAPKQAGRPIPRHYRVKHSLSIHPSIHPSSLSLSDSHGFIHSFNHSINRSTSRPPFFPTMRHVTIRL
jgi:hypothetical protein